MFLVSQRAYLTDAQQGFVFVLSVIALIGWLVVLIAGLFSRGAQRVLLLLYGGVIAFAYVLIAASNFGR